MTVTGIALPASSKICVCPTLRPSSPIAIAVFPVRLANRVCEDKRFARGELTGQTAIQVAVRPASHYPVNFRGIELISKLGTIRNSVLSRTARFNLNVDSRGQTQLV